MARHIGGAVNYVGVAETLSITPSAQAAGLAADSLICAFYFAGIFKLASSIGPDAAPSASDPSASSSEADSEARQETGGIQVISCNPAASTVAPCSATGVNSNACSSVNSNLCLNIHC